MLLSCIWASVVKFPPIQASQRAIERQRLLQYPAMRGDSDESNQDHPWQTYRFAAAKKILRNLNCKALLRVVFVDGRNQNIPFDYDRSLTPSFLSISLSSRSNAEFDGGPIGFRNFIFFMAEDDELPVEQREECRDWRWDRRGRRVGSARKRRFGSRKFALQPE